MNLIELNIAIENLLRTPTKNRKRIQEYIDMRREYIQTINILCHE